ncbi:MAG: EamA family transporter RarD [Gammaproteobacteria bacterium]|nr:EamA family transporter RarD [Gammaproteobacteria bacterium]
MMRGYLIILTGYIGWGMFPLYWSLLNHVPALEVLLHRMLWSMPVLFLFIAISARRRTQVTAALHSWSSMRLLIISSLFISLNWGIYIWAVANQRVIEASMGYFLTPLLNVLTGVIVFRERIDGMKKVAIVFAAVGVLYYIISTSIIPWVGLTVGISFASYGFLRKQMDTNAIPGLFIETLVLLPFTLALMFWLHHQSEAVFLNYQSTTDWLLILGGPITVLPLAFFTAGTRILPMTTVGVLFYVTPTLQFLSGIFILGESFDSDRLIGFAGIWIGLGIFTYSLIRGKETLQG